MGDVFKINDNLDIKRTGGVYGAGAPAAVSTDDRVYDTASLSEAAAQLEDTGDATSNDFLDGTYFIDEVDNGNSGAAKTIDFTNKANQKLTLTANCTLTFVDPPSARPTVIRFLQGGSGSYSVTLPATVTGTNPTLSSGVGTSTVVNFFFDGNGGWHV